MQQDGRIKQQSNHEINRCHCSCAFKICRQQLLGLRCCNCSHQQVSQSSAKSASVAVTILTHTSLIQLSCFVSPAVLLPAPPRSSAESTLSKMRAAALALLLLGLCSAAEQKLPPSVTLSNSQGFKVVLTPIGATIQNIFVPDCKMGKPLDVALGWVQLVGTAAKRRPFDSWGPARHAILLAAVPRMQHCYHFGLLTRACTQAGAAVKSSSWFLRPPKQWCCAALTPLLLPGMMTQQAS